jgi:hypothetical protein
MGKGKASGQASRTAHLLQGLGAQQQISSRYLIITHFGPTSQAIYLPVAY